MKTFKSVLFSLILTVIPPALPAQTPLPVAVAPDQAAILYSGRRDDSQAGGVKFGYSGARVRMAFDGEAAGMKMDSAKPNWVNIFIDGKKTAKLKVEGTDQYYELASGLPKGVHTVEVAKATEGSVGPVVFKGFFLPEGAKAVEWPHPQTRKIEFIGDSITCGYGIEVNDAKLHFTPDTENFCDTYAWLAATALDADFLVVARSGIGIFRNYNGPDEGSKDNMPSIYERSIFGQPEPVWDPARFTPDVVCINLGTNDFSTKGVDQAKYEAAYVSFAQMLLARYPKSRFVLLIGPMQNGQKIKDSVARVAEALNQNGEKRVSVFEMSKAGAHGFGADYHPSQEQAKINGAELAKYLSDLMQWPLVSQ